MSEKTLNRYLELPITNDWTDKERGFIIMNRVGGKRFQRAADAQDRATLKLWGFTTEERQNKFIDTFGRTEEEWDRHTLGEKYPRGTLQLVPGSKENRAALGMLKKMKETNWDRAAQRQEEESKQRQRKEAQDQPTRVTVVFKHTMYKEYEIRHCSTS
jgi:hypothetical protein